MHSYTSLSIAVNNKHLLNSFRNCIVIKYAYDLYIIDIYIFKFFFACRRNFANVPPRACVPYNCL